MMLLGARFCFFLWIYYRAFITNSCTRCGKVLYLVVQNGCSTSPRALYLRVYCSQMDSKAPIMEKLPLTAENYGSVRRYFIRTLDDRMPSPDVQEKLVRHNPPHQVFKLKVSDESGCG